MVGSLENFHSAFNTLAFAADAIGYVKAVCRFENGSWSARLERQQCHRHRDGMCGRRQREPNSAVIITYEKRSTEWHHYSAILRDRIVGRLVDAQVCHDRFGRSMSQPLREREVLKTIDLSEHFQEHQVGVACVLDVME